jgi:hypothetical protein
VVKKDQRNKEKFYTLRKELTDQPRSMTGVIHKALKSIPYMTQSPSLRRVSPDRDGTAKIYSYSDFSLIKTLTIDRLSVSYRGT